jgi:phage gp46-like protein
MPDITTIWDSERGDWATSGATLRAGSDLETAVVLSLFTDRVAAEDDASPDGSGDPRGWWGDDTQQPIGSRLWLLQRAKRTQETLSLAQSYIEEALKWLIDDGVAASIDVYVEWQQQHMLGARVTVYRTDGTSAALDYSWAWNGIN